MKYIAFAKDSQFDIALKKADETQTTSEASTENTVQDVTPSTNDFNGGLANNASDLATLVLTEEEAADLANGASVKVWVAVEDISDNVSSSDKASVEAAIQNLSASYTVGKYLDLDLFKAVNDTQTQITRTNGKVSITLTLPEDLQGDNRTYKVVRIHEEAATVLDIQILT
ncbi:MAG: hypothetical protein IJ232_00760 [Lachnospiraceae bacterium]|nr:hypothetical protein [Lachnospiraceae bacterium]